MTDQPHHPHSLICENEGERTLSWAPQVITDSGQWTGNHLRFATKEEAEMFLAEFRLLRNHGLWKHPIRSTTAGRTDGSCASDVSADGYGMVAVGGCSMRWRTPPLYLVPPMTIAPIIPIR